MVDGRVREAYAARAAEYSILFGSAEAATEHDRQLLLAWAQGTHGRIIDVGCGPGHWTSYLHDNGVDIEGIDPVPEFIDEARQRFPGVDYRIGHADRLETGDGSLGGVLAWYSLIHTAPDRIGGILDELARSIRPDGGLLTGFFEGAELAPFDHAVTTAYLWPVDLLASRVERAGFVVTDIHTRAGPGTRPQGVITARRDA